MADPGVQESSKRGLSTFLADHEDCGGGFDIQRRDGSEGSIVRVICGGCGKAIEYPAAAQVELPAEQPVGRRLSQRRPSRNRRPEASVSPPQNSHPAAALAASGGNDSIGPSPIAGSEEQSRSFGLPGWLSAGLIVALIAGGLLLIVLGVASNSGTPDSTPSASAPPPGTVELTTPKRPPQAARAIHLERRTLAERVSVGIPAGWRSGVAGGAATVLAPNGKSQVQVYFEQGGAGGGSLMSQSRSFLLQRHAGSHVSGVDRTEVAGRRVQRITVSFPAGTESAVVLFARGYTYLILERLARPVSPQLRRETAAIVASFRPA